MDIDGSKIAVALKTILNTLPSDNGEDILFNNSLLNNNYSIKKRILDAAVKALKDSESYEETVIFSPKNYEVLVALKSPSIFTDNLSDPSRKGYTIHDKENKIIYELGPPSNEYLLYLIHSSYDNDQLREKISRNIGIYDYVYSNDAKADLFDALRESIGFKTIKISSEKEADFDLFNKFADSLIFQLGYNRDIAAIKQWTFEDDFHRYSKTVFNRLKPEDIDIPKRFYNTALINHYQLALGAADLSSKFLSYYHVIEHFFKKIFDQNMIEEVRQRITLPNFSYKNDDEIGKLIDFIVRKQKKKKDEFITFDECLALELTLKEYVKIDELLQNIREFDESLIDYYKNNKVSFSDGNKVDLESNDEEQVCKCLSERIYKTRNSIVHSKDGDKKKYTPFTDDKELAKEIPLIRLVAEQIIINSSELMT